MRVSRRLTVVLLAVFLLLGASITMLLVLPSPAADAPSRADNRSDVGAESRSGSRINAPRQIASISDNDASDGQADETATPAAQTAGANDTTNADSESGTHVTRRLTLRVSDQAANPITGANLRVEFTSEAGRYVDSSTATTQPDGVAVVRLPGSAAAGAVTATHVSYERRVRFTKLPTEGDAELTIVMEAGRLLTVVVTGRAGESIEDVQIETAIDISIGAMFGKSYSVPRQVGPNEWEVRLAKTTELHIWAPGYADLRLTFEYLESATWATLEPVTDERSILRVALPRQVWGRLVNDLGVPQPHVDLKFFQGRFLGSVTTDEHGEFKALGVGAGEPFKANVLVRESGGVADNVSLREAVSDESGFVELVWPRAGSVEVEIVNLPPETAVNYSHGWERATAEWLHLPGAARAVDDNVIPGIYEQVWIDAPGYAPHGPYTIEVQPAEHTVLRVTLVHRGGTARGRVVDRDGNPVPGVTVRTDPGYVQPKVPDSMRATATTDADGRFELRELPIGEVRLEVIRGSRVHARASIDLIEGQEVDIGDLVYVDW